MIVSDQIISVLNALCEKFGIVVDWTTANILPYAKDLCGRIITYEIATEIAFSIFIIIITIALGFTFRFFFKKGKENEWFSDGLLVGAIMTGVCFGISLIITIIVVPCSIMSIIKACTLPELTIIEMVEGLIS